MHSIRDTTGEGDAFTPELAHVQRQECPGAFVPDGLHGVPGQPGKGVSLKQG